MKVSELGEFGLIDMLARMAQEHKDSRQASWGNLLIGIGDDAAAWCGEAVQIGTVDVLVQDVHFSLDFTPWPDLGWKAMAVNLSDIAAMGGQPRYALVSMALPGHIDVEDARALYRGMLDLADRFGVAIIGGNISSAPLIVLNVTVIGSQVGGRHLLTRSTARIGEQIAVSGELGAAAGGLEMLSRKLEFEAEAAARLRQAFLHPFPRIAEAQALVEAGVRTAIDISDGLLADLGHICDASQVSARIYVEHVPVSPAVKAHFGERALELALSGGEDYEILFTGSPAVMERVRQAAGCLVDVIGEVVVSQPGQEKITLVDGGGSIIKPGRRGWEHF